MPGYLSILLALTIMVTLLGLTQAWGATTFTTTPLASSPPTPSSVQQQALVPSQVFFWKATRRKALYLTSPKVEQQQEAVLDEPSTVISSATETQTAAYPHVRRKRPAKKKKKNRKPVSSAVSDLVPTQVLLQVAGASTEPLEATTVGDPSSPPVTTSPQPPSVVRTPKDKKKKNPQNQSTSLGPSVTTSRINHHHNPKKQQALQAHEALVAATLQEAAQRGPSQGYLPNIYWQAISMDHLRLHPSVVPLPTPETLIQSLMSSSSTTTGRPGGLTTLEDVRYFRQDSWQWDVLHAGRCTTSQAAAALGFLELSAAHVLQIPPSWRSSHAARSTWQRLQPSESVVRTWDDLNRVLLQPPHPPSSSSSSPTEASGGAMNTSPDDNLALWTKTDAEEAANTTSVSGVGRWLAEYHPASANGPPPSYEAWIRQAVKEDSVVQSLRMRWGRTQEATSLLTALNYLSRDDPLLQLREVGLCGAGLQVTNYWPSSLLIGASPDAVLCYSDGRIEALEVKNHCPFYLPSLKVSSKQQHRGKPTRSSGKPRGRAKLLAVYDRPLQDEHILVAAQYIPQLMMEMYCLGPACQSAVMVRQTATKGALLLRMRRNEDWIQEMLYWLHRFQLDYVETKCPPPSNFFWESDRIDERSRYRTFVNRTMELRNQIEKVAYIPNDQIQRAGGSGRLFLDEL